MDLISVCIPVYNCHDYIGRCLDSIVNQTYRELEIIIVDDGSNDGTELICNEYAEKDDRIHVFHQANSGVSVARNVAISNCHGDWIAFVDSDDYLENNAFEILMDKVNCHSADILMYKYQSITKGKIKQYMDDSDIPFGRITREEALTLLSTSAIGNYLWNKLFRKWLFDGVVFPVGEIFEDVAVLYTVFEKTDSFYRIDNVLYNYCREGMGIVYTFNKKRLSDIFYARKDQYEHFLENGYNAAAKKCRDRLMCDAFLYVRHVKDHKSKEYRDCSDELCRDNYYSPYLYKRQKQLLFVFRHFRLLFNLLCHVKGRQV